MIKQNVDAEFLNQSFIISGSISIKSNAGNFIGSYKLENAFGESFQVNDIFGRKVFLAEPTISNELIGQLDERSLEIYQYFQEWGSISSILLAIDDFDELKSKLNISITYRGTQIVNSYRIPRTISVIGNDYELTFAIKKLNFT